MKVKLLGLAIGLTIILIIVGLAILINVVFK
jgi:hypothetical protein